MKVNWRPWGAAAVLLAGAWWSLRGVPVADWRALSGLVPAGLVPGPHLLSNLGWALSSAALAALLLLLYDSAGVRLSAFVLGRRPCGPLRFAAVFAGYGASSVATLGGAAAGLWYPSALTAGLLLLACLGFPEFPRVVGEWTGGIRAAWRDSSVPARAAGILLAAWWALLLVPPELGIDCLEYHLTCPQQMLVTHRLIGRDVYLGCPLPIAADFPNVFPVLFRLDAAAKMLRPVLAGLGALALLRSLRLPLSRAWEPAVVCLALLVPAARNYSAFAKSDGIIAGAVLAFSAALLESGAFAGSARSLRALLVAALLAGFAASSKYVTAPLLAVIMLGALACLRHRERGKAAAVLLAGGLVPLLPWMGRSLFFFADPLYPAGSVWMPSLFGEPAWNKFTKSAYEMFVRESRPRAAFLGETLSFALRNGFPLLAGALFLRGRAVPGTRALGLASLAGLAATVLAIRGGADFVERYTYPVYIGWCAVGVAAFTSAVRKPLTVPVLGVTAGVFMLAMTGAHLASFPGVTPADFIAGRLSRGEFRSRGTYAYGAVLPDIRKACASVSRPSSLVTLGNRLMWDIPVRVIGEGFEPPFIWKAVRESDSRERLGIKFRQGGVRWLLYNNPLEGWYRFTYTPWEWDHRMLRLYLEFARRRLLLLASSGRCDPVYGDNWLYVVAEKDGPPARRILFLPGAERALSFASLARVAGANAEAVARFRAAHRELPEVAWIDALLAEALTAVGGWPEARALAGGAVREGLRDETCLLTWARAAARTGRKGEAREALEMAAQAYPLLPERVSAARLDCGL